MSIFSRDALSAGGLWFTGSRTGDGDLFFLSVLGFLGGLSEEWLGDVFLLVCWLVSLLCAGLCGKGSGCATVLMASSLGAGKAGEEGCVGGCVCKSVFCQKSIAENCASTIPLSFISLLDMSSISASVLIFDLLVPLILACD